MSIQIIRHYIQSMILYPNILSSIVFSVKTGVSNKMEFVQLTDEQREEFEENGYFIVRSVLDEKMIERLTEAGDRIVKSRDTDAQYVHIRDGLVSRTGICRIDISN